METLFFKISRYRSMMIDIDVYNLIRMDMDRYGNIIFKISRYRSMMIDIDVYNLIKKNIDSYNFRYR